jgi:hypothetical protein
MFPAAHKSIFYLGPANKEFQNSVLSSGALRSAGEGKYAAIGESARSITSG